MPKKLWFVSAAAAIVISVLLGVWSYYSAPPIIAQENAQKKSADECLLQFYECAPRELIKEICSGTFQADGFGVQNDEKELADVDNFVMSIHQSDEWRGYVIVYGGRQNKRGEVRARGERIRKYVAERVGESRITFVHGGFRDKLTIELWISTSENCTPPIKPTVDPEYVRFKGRARDLDGYYP